MKNQLHGKTGMVALAFLTILAMATTSTTAWTQVSTCVDVCAQFPLPESQLVCMGAALNNAGHPVYSTVVCANVENQAECLACYAAITPTDQECAAYFQICSVVGGEGAGGLDIIGDLEDLEGSGAFPIVTGASPAIPTQESICTETEPCTCTGGQQCRLSCPTGACEITCGGGAACTSDCPLGNCTVTCAAGSSCTANCAGGSCGFTCAAGASCTFDCPGGDCTSTCAVGSTCTQNCVSGNCSCIGSGCQ